MRLSRARSQKSAALRTGANTDHPQNKHNEDNRNPLCGSTGFLYCDTGRPLKRQNEANAKNTPLKKQCLCMTNKPKNKDRKSKAHGEWHHNEPSPVLHGNGLVEYQPRTSRNKKHAA